MTETEKFLAEMTQRITDCEITLHNGDAAPRIAMWSRTEPLTLFGAAMSGRGWAEIGPVFRQLGIKFANCTSYRNEIIAAEASGDLAYTVALEHVTASVDGTVQSYTLRATTVFRRENGDWKVVHQHGDSLSAEPASAIAALARDGQSG